MNSVHVGHKEGTARTEGCQRRRYATNGYCIQTELAKRMNVSRPYVTKVLTHDVNFSFKTAIKLANALQT